MSNAALAALSNQLLKAQRLLSLRIDNCKLIIAPERSL